MQHRIDRLENLVLSLVSSNTDGGGSAAADQALSMTMDSSASNTEFTPTTMDDSFREHDHEQAESETDGVTKSFGVLHFQNNKAMYIGEAHWAAILNDVRTKTRRIDVTPQMLTIL